MSTYDPIRPRSPACPAGRDGDIEGEARFREFLRDGCLRVILVMLAMMVTFFEGCAGSAPRFTSKTAGSVSASPSHQLDGIASYYADEFNGRTTSNGEVFDMHKLTAAHRTLPFGTRVRVTNQENGRSVVVRINDRGPFKDNRVIDLSLEGARQLGMLSNGTARVALDILDSAPSR